MLTFRPAYFIVTVVIFIIEVLIALYVHDSIVRPFIGDLLVVILIYCFMRSFINLPAWQTAIIVLIFAYTVETLQYFNIIEKLGLEHSKPARIIIGTTFTWTDLIAYTIGIILILYIEKILAGKKETDLNSQASKK